MLFLNALKKKKKKHFLMGSCVSCCRSDSISQGECANGS